MAAAMNGMAAHGGLRPFGSTFLVFSDYMKPSIRLAALMGLPVIYIGTHDSIGVGEDGPTHQPIEHLAMLRAIPNLVVLRPGDANETVEAWRTAILRREGPTLLALTRQKLPVLDRSGLGAADGVRRGGYVLYDPPGPPQAILLATGSELNVALDAARRLGSEGVRARVVSLPSWELFAAQPPEYRESVLPAGVRARVSVEAATSFGWHRWLGDAGEAVSLDHFGASAPGERLFEEFGFTAAHVADTVRRVLSRLPERGPADVGLHSPDFPRPVDHRGDGAGCAGRLPGQHRVDHGGRRRGAQAALVDLPPDDQVDRGAAHHGEPGGRHRGPRRRPQAGRPAGAEVVRVLRDRHDRGPLRRARRREPGQARRRA